MVLAHFSKDGDYAISFTLERGTCVQASRRALDSF